MISPLNAKLDRKWIEASAEITELRAEIAALKVQKEQYKGAAENLGKQLLAAQHRIKELREALDEIPLVQYEDGDEVGAFSCCGSVSYKGHRPDCIVAKALATPDNAAEIDALVRDAVEREREACAACVPASWLDPMLAGEQGVIFNRAREGAVEAVLIAVRGRIRARSNV